MIVIRSFYAQKLFALYSLHFRFYILIKKYVLKFKVVMLGIGQKLTFPISARIRPKKFVRNLLFFSFGLIANFERFRNSFNIGKGSCCRSNTTMDAKDTVLNNSCQRQLVENSIDLVPDWVRIINVFLEFKSTLITKSHKLIDSSIFMGPSQQKYVFGVLKLEWKQQNYSFKTLDTSVNVVTQKHVIDWLYVAVG